MPPGGTRQFPNLIKLPPRGAAQFPHSKSTRRRPTATILRLKKLPRRGARQFPNLLKLPPRGAAQFLHPKSARRRPTAIILRLYRLLPATPGQFLYAIESMFQYYEKDFPEYLKASASIQKSSTPTPKARFNNQKSSHKTL